MEIIKKKRVSIEGSNGIYEFDYRYVEHGREEVFNKCMKGAGSSPSFSIIEFEMTRGYLSPKDSPPTDGYYKLISETPTTEDEIRQTIYSNKKY